jgi:3',5'-cyclic AMP phosphodiesterase CpdA
MARREALRLTAGALLTMGLWPGALAAQETKTEKFRFIVINDTHYMSPECGGFLDRIVHQMRYHRGIQFCLHAGDLVEKGLHDHLATVRKIFAELGVPVYTVPGNHDYLTNTDRTAYDSLFPDRLNYSFEHGGWQFIALDSTQGSAYEKTKIQPATLRWVDDLVPRLDRNRPTVILTHFPLGTGVRYRPANADALLEKFRDVNLRAVFNGHFHGFTEHQYHNAPVTTNRCCALKRDNHDKTKEKGYFVCTANNGVIEREFVEVMFRPFKYAGKRPQDQRVKGQVLWPDKPAPKTTPSAK